MPVKRRVSKVRDHRITPEAAAAFRAGDATALHRALGLPPWVVSPLEVTDDDVCPWPPGSGGAMGWPVALELRRALVAAEEDQPCR